MPKNYDNLSYELIQNQSSCEEITVQKVSDLNKKVESLANIILSKDEEIESLKQNVVDCVLLVTNI